MSPSRRPYIATVSLFGTLDEKLHAIAAAGFEAIELCAGDVTTVAEARHAGDMARQLGLSVDLFQPLRDFEGVDDALFKASLERAKSSLEMASVAGAPLMLVCSNANDAVDDDARAADQLAALAELACASGIRIGYEALAWGKFVKTFDHALAIVTQANHPALGLVLDSFHTLVRPEDWSDIGKIPPEMIFFVQLGDAPDVAAADYMTLRREHSNLPGEGHLDVTGFLRAVMGTGYDGPVSIEIFNLIDKTPAFKRAKSAAASLAMLWEDQKRATE